MELSDNSHETRGSVSALNEAENPCSKRRTREGMRRDFFLAKRDGER